MRRERDAHGDDVEGLDALVAHDEAADARTRVALTTTGSPWWRCPTRRTGTSSTPRSSRPSGQPSPAGRGSTRGHPCAPPAAGRTRRRAGRLLARSPERGLATTWRFPFACECGRSRCTAVWLGRPEEYPTAAAAGRAVAPEHR